MRNLWRGLGKLEALRFDSKGLVPHSEAWFAYYMDILDRNMRGEEVDCIAMTIAVFDRIVEDAERAEREERDRLAAACEV